jgi:hypothetical protein
MSPEDVVDQVGAKLHPDTHLHRSSEPASHVAAAHSSEQAAEEPQMWLGCLLGLGLAADERIVAGGEQRPVVA